MNITKENIRTYTDRMRSAMPATAALSHAQALQVFCRTLYNRSYEECLASNFSLGSPAALTQPAEPSPAVRKRIKKSDWVISYQEYQKLLKDLETANWSEGNDRKYTCSFDGLTYILDMCALERYGDIDDVRRITVYDGKQSFGKIQEQVRPDTLRLSWFQDDNEFLDDPFIAEIHKVFPNVSVQCSMKQKYLSDDYTIHAEIQNCENSVKEVNDWCKAYIDKQARQQGSYAWMDVDNTGELVIPRSAYTDLQSTIRIIVRRFHPLAWFPEERNRTS